MTTRHLKEHARAPLDLRDSYIRRYTSRQRFGGRECQIRYEVLGSAASDRRGAILR